MSLGVLLRPVCVSLALSAAASPASAEQSPPDSPQAREIVAFVDRAAELVHKQGKAAFAEFRKQGSEWFHGNTYVFAYDMKGNVLLNPAFPKREGTNIAGGKDENGKPFQEEILKTAQTKGHGWISYVFPKPGQTQPSEKWTYVKRVELEGAPALIGAGFYPTASDEAPSQPRAASPAK